MLKRFVCILALGAFALPVAAHAQAAGKEHQQVLQIEKDRFAAMVKVDEAALNRVLADDLAYIHSNAVLQTKNEFIADLKKGTIKYVSIMPSEPDQKVRVYGSVAVVNGVAAVNVIDHGNDLKFKIRYTVVQANRNGAWQTVSWESTKFPQ